MLKATTGVGLLWPKANDAKGIYESLSRDAAKHRRKSNLDHQVITGHAGLFKNAPFLPFDPVLMQYTQGVCCALNPS